MRLKVWGRGPGQLRRPQRAPGRPGGRASVRDIPPYNPSAHPGTGYLSAQSAATLSSPDLKLTGNQNPSWLSGSRCGPGNLFFNLSYNLRIKTAVCLGFPFDFSILHPSDVPAPAPPRTPTALRLSPLLPTQGGKWPKKGKGTGVKGVSSGGVTP